LISPDTRIAWTESVVQVVIWEREEEPALVREEAACCGENSMDLSLKGLLEGMGIQ
jgi:hypothetical protein